MVKCIAKCYSEPLFEENKKSVMCVTFIKYNPNNNNVYTYNTFVWSGKVARLGYSIGNRGNRRPVPKNMKLQEKEIKDRIRKILLENPAIKVKELIDKIKCYSGYKIRRNYMIVKRELYGKGYIK